MSCTLDRVAGDGVVYFEGKTGADAVLTVAANSAATLVAAVYDGEPLTVVNNRTRVVLKSGERILLTRVETPEPRAWVRLVEIRDGETRILTRFKTQSPPEDRQLRIRGVDA